MNETKLSGESLDILSENISKLKELFPEIVTEDKINFDKFKEVFGNYVEDSPERYNFTWKGKSAALRLAQTPSTGTLRPCKEESKNWDTTENLYIEGDNLEVLKLLQKSYYGKIKMIYIDPPYNTGKEFVYPDNFKDNLKNYLEITGQVDPEGTKISTNTDSSGRYHTNWLNMMYPRLRLARNLLTNDGVIFISIDENEAYNLKILCDGVFGADNYISNIIWQSRTSISNDQPVSLNHNHTLIYCKNRDFLEFGGEPLDHEDYSNPDNDPRGPWKLVPIDANKAGGDTVYPILNPNTGEEYYPPNRRIWAFNRREYERLFNEGRIKFGKNDNSAPKKKLYLNERLEKGDRKTPSSILLDAGTTKNGTTEIMNFFNNKKIFDYPKPTSFIVRLINYAINDYKSPFIILDFFSGSAPTANAVMQSNAQDYGNLKFIMVQLPEPTDEKSVAFNEGFKNICEIGKERIRRAGDNIVSEINQKGQTSLNSKSNNDLDIGFKVFKLDSSNLSKWDPEYDNLEQSLLDSVENLVPGRNELDLVYEIMLKYGIDLTLPIEEYPIKNKKFYSIGFGALIISLDDNLTSDLASEIIKLKDKLSPEVMRVVFKDNGFASDSDKTNIKETLKTNGIEEFVTL